MGAKVPIYMEESYSEEMLKNQIQHIKYEKDLIALNEICDISINPIVLVEGIQLQVVFQMEYPY